MASHSFPACAHATSIPDCRFSPIVFFSAAVVIHLIVIVAVSIYFFFLFSILTLALYAVTVKKSIFNSILFTWRISSYLAMQLHCSRCFWMTLLCAKLQTQWAKRQREEKRSSSSLISSAVSTLNDGLKKRRCRMMGKKSCRPSTNATSN